MHACGHDGHTAIGDGLERAHDHLELDTSHDIRSTIVFTDGHETAEKNISQVTAIINERVYAIGLGTADEIQPSTLTTLTNGTGGYFNLTGEIDADTPLLLSKYFLQILAGVTKDQILKDPMGWLVPGRCIAFPSKSRRRN